VEGRERETVGKGERVLDLDICPGAPEFLVTPLSRRHKNTVADRFLTDLTTVTETVEFFCLRVNRGHSGHPADQPICLQLPLRDACVEGK